MPRLIYVLDGIEAVGGNGKRFKLLNRMCFTEKTESEKLVSLWERVMKYIDTAYDYNYLEKIYIMGDGDSWIKGGVDVLGSRAVLYWINFI